MLGFSLTVVDENVLWDYQAAFEWKDVWYDMYRARNTVLFRRFSGSVVLHADVHGTL